MAVGTGEPREPIAVVGLGCRLPGDINSKDALWEALLQAKDLLSEVPRDRFDVDQFHDDGKRKFGKVNNRRGGFLSDPYTFDAEFWGMSPAEAARIDPQQRMALEATVHAVEDSGTPLENIAGSRTSVFFGSFTNDHSAMTTSALGRDYVTSHAAMGTAAASLPNRISHRLDLRGPSVFMDTACSSSLVAVHYACQSIWSNEADNAIAGGANAILRPEFSILMSRAGFISADGSCKSFDADADGYVRSEGCGVVYLKRLSAAIRDKDRIYALVKGSLVNSDGYTADGFAVPSMSAQSRLLQDVYRQAHVDPATVSYVEAHGPGTQVGDPKEAGAVGGFFAPHRRRLNDEPLFMGSIKGNIGHLEGAAGIAGFIKAVLVTYHNQIPPQANHKKRNPNINFDALGLTIPIKTHSLGCPSATAVHVGVNSFGAGGTNAHVVLAVNRPGEIHYPKLNGKSLRIPSAFVLAARSLNALESSARSLASLLTTSRPALADVAYTLAYRRSRHQHVCIIPAADIDTLTLRLEQVAEGKPSKDVLLLHRSSKTGPRIALAFSGQGGQWFGMGQQMFETEPIFRHSLLNFDQYFKKLSGFSILAKIFKTTQVLASLESTVIVQPGICAVQIALADTLMAYGLQPEAIVGHSVGEVAAAYVSGALTLEQAVETIFMRASIQDQAAGLGSMLAIGLGETETTALLRQLGLEDRVEIAAMNGPKLTTISGDDVSLLHVNKILSGGSTFCRKVNVDVPYHSRFMDPLEQELVQSLTTIRAKPTKIALYSTVTAQIEPGTHLTGAYWFENVRKPVKYVETCRRMIDDGIDFFLEVGPHPVLVSGTRGIAELAGRKIHVHPSMARNDDITPFAKALATGHALGCDVKLNAFNGGGGHIIDLPLYPFDRHHHSFEHPEDKQHRLGYSSHPFYQSATSLTDDGRGTMRLSFNTGKSPYLLDHVVDGAAILPATAHIEAAYLAATHLLPEQDISDVWLQDLRFQHALVLAPSGEVAPQSLLEMNSINHDYSLSSRSANAKPAENWQISSRGRFNTLDRFPLDSKTPQLSDILSELHTWRSCNVEDFYTMLEKSSLQYGETFRSVRKVWQLGSRVFALVTIPDDLKRESMRYRLHPALFDACLHAGFVDIDYRGDFRSAYLPSHIDAIRVNDASGVTTAYVYTQVLRHDDINFKCDFTIISEDGVELAVGRGMTAKRLPTTSSNAHYTYGWSYPEIALPESRILADIRNIFMLGIGGETNGLAESVRKLLPDVHIVHESIDLQDKLPFSGHRLDARSVIIVRALSAADPSGEDELSPVIGTILQIAHWIRDSNSSPRVVILTGGAEAKVGANLLSAALEGALRVLACELPSARFRIVDLGLPSPDNMLLLRSELCYDELSHTEGYVAIRSGRRHVRRVIHGPGTTITKALPARGGMYHCDVQTAGAIDSISFQRHHAEPLRSNQVRVEIHATGLNFKDVMNAAGLLEERAVQGGLCGSRLGLEIAGRVTEIGGGVTNLQVGDLVMGIAAHGLAGSTVAFADHLSHVPDSMSMEQAATSVVVYMTAYYGLVHLARIEPGESVLIHAGAGGVGTAAIKVAKHAGARVFVTAGSEHKRQWLVEQGVEAVFDSRSAAFHDDVKTVTGGRGVDVVLNSLTGSLLAQSVACLAPFGRHVEIGKTDIYRDAKLGLEQLGDNKSFSVVDIDRLAAQKPQLYHRLQEEVVGLLRDGSVAPVPITQYPITQVGEALKHLSRSKVIGKVAVSMPADMTVETEAPSVLALRSDRSYLITGGASGLGLQLARFLVERGARHLILSSRNGPKTLEDRTIVSEMRALGVEVHLEALDVTAKNSVQSLFARSDTWPPIAGIIHCAAVLLDLFSFNMKVADFWTAFRPKAIGAWNLHEATSSLQLDFFVLTSSIASMFGFPGEFSYSSSNQYLNALAEYRHAQGLPALSLQIGLLGEYAGISRVADIDGMTISVEDALRPQGVNKIPLPPVFAAFEEGVLDQSSQRAVFDFDINAYKRSHPHLLREGAIKHLENNSGTEAGTSQAGSKMWKNMTETARTNAISEHLCKGIAKMTGFKIERISLDDKIDYYASDSLTITQLRGFIVREFKVNIPFMRLMSAPEIRELVAEIAVSFNQDNGVTESASVVDTKASVFPDDLKVISPWLVRGRGTSPRPRRVICFHPAGTGASFFSSFLTNPPPNLDIIAVQMPGRESRTDEPAALSLTQIVEGVLADLPPVGADDVFWGASFGGVFAYEVLRQLQSQGKPLPKLLISGSIPPHRYKQWEKRELARMMISPDTNADTFLAMMGFVDNAEFIRPIIEATRMDVAIIKSYEFNPEKTVLNTSITAYAGRLDDLVYSDDVEAWGELTEEFKFVEVEGSHFFVHQHEAKIRKTLQELAGV